MSRNMWILAALFAVLAIAMMYQESTGNLERPWAQCKESMVQQMLFDECTPRTGGLGAPAQNDGVTSSEPAADDGVGKVDRGN